MSGKEQGKRLLGPRPRSAPDDGLTCRSKPTVELPAHPKREKEL